MLGALTDTTPGATRIRYHATVIPLRPVGRAVSNPSLATYRPGDTNNSLNNIYSLDAIGTDNCQKELLREGMLALRILAELLGTMVGKV